MLRGSRSDSLQEEKGYSQVGVSDRNNERGNLHVEVGLDEGVRYVDYVGGDVERLDYI